MKIVELPPLIIQKAIDAVILQKFWSPQTLEARSLEVKRKTTQIGEYVCAIIEKEMKSKKILPHYK
jgi:hypothetical protein